MPKVFKNVAEALKAIAKFIVMFNRFYAEEVQRLAKMNLDLPGPPFGNTTTLTGATSDGIIVRRVSETEWVCISTAPWSVALEEGSRPHFPPIEPLKKWARLRLGDEQIAYAVQRKIAKEGTRAQPFMGPAMDDAFTFAYQRAYDKVFL